MGYSYILHVTRVRRLASENLSSLDSHKGMCENDPLHSHYPPDSNRN